MVIFGFLCGELNPELSGESRVSWPLDHREIFFVKNLGLHRVGFEPTRPKPAELKSAPLDHSGICAFFVKKN